MRLGVRGPIPGQTLHERAEALKRTGFEGIELGPEWLDRPAEQIRADLAGLAVTAIVGSIQLLRPDRAAREAAIQLDRERIRLARELGAEAVIEVPVFGPCPFPDLRPVISPRELEDQLLIAGLKELVPDLEQTGVNLLLEPLNRYETHYMNRQEHAAQICQAVGSPRIKILADFFHMHIEEPSLAGALRKVGPHLGYIHVADSNRLEPGAGFQDFRTPFAALKEVGYDGWITLESGASGDPETALREARQRLQTWWEEA